MKQLLLLIWILTFCDNSHAQVCEPLGKGLRTVGEISDIAYDSINDRLYVAGYFESVGGIQCNNIAMFDGNQWHDMQGGCPGYVSSIELINANLYVGGSFDNAGGVSVKNVAMWDGNSWSQMGNLPPTYYTVMDLAVMKNELYLSAFLTNNGNPATGITKWNSSGWATQGTTISNSTIKMMSMKDSMLIFGNFTSLAGNPFNCTVYDGATFQDYNYPGLGNSQITDAAFFNQAIYIVDNNRKINRWNNNGWDSLSTLPGPCSKIFFHGDSLFAAYVIDGIFAPDTIKISSLLNGTPVTTDINSIGDSYSFLFNADCEYKGTILLGGSFTNCNDRGLKSIIQYNNGVATSFAGVANTYDQSVDDALAISFAFDSISQKLITGGAFHFAGDSVANNIATWNGNTWEQTGEGFNALVTQLKWFNGELYAIGRFTKSGSTPLKSLAKWNGNSWVPVLNSINGRIYTMEVYHNQLYLGGNFTSLNGINIMYVAKYNGVTFTTVGGNVLDEPVNSLILFGDSLVAYSNISFTMGTWPNNTYTYLACYHNNVWTAMNDSYSGQVNDFLVYHDSLFLSSENFDLHVYKYNGTGWDQQWTGSNFIGSTLLEIKGNICLSTQEGFYMRIENNWERIMQIYAIDAFKLDSLNYILGGFFPYTYLGTDKVVLNNVAKFSFDKPRASFHQDQNSICEHDYVQYTADTCIFNSQYTWSFPGGYPAYSNSQMPVIKYNTAGVYDVFYKTVNALGVDSIIKYSTISVHSCTVSVNENTFEKSVAIFPNPSHTSFQLESENPFTNVEIYNVNGVLYKTFFYAAGISTINYKCEDWKEGMYIVKIRTEKESIITRLTILW